MVAICQIKLNSKTSPNSVQLINHFNRAQLVPKKKLHNLSERRMYKNLTNIH